MFLTKVLGKIFFLLIYGLPLTISVFEECWIDNAKDLLKAKLSAFRVDWNMDGTA